MSDQPWTEWEDFRAGLYAARPVDGDRIEASWELLTDPDQLLEVAVEMIREWPLAARHGIGDLPDGSQAWVGQAACCYAHGANSAESRAAWARLSNPEQRAANAAADIAINRFRKEIIDGAQTLFGD